jgi:hypothetical protein
VVSLSADHTNYSHFSVDRRCHPGFAFLSNEVVWFVAFAAVMALRISHSLSVKLLEYGIGSKTAFLFDLSLSAKIPNGFYKC